MYNINCYSLKQLCIEIIHVNHINITTMEKLASPRRCHCKVQDGGSNSQSLVRYTNDFYIDVQVVMCIQLRVIPTIYLSEYTRSLSKYNLFAWVDQAGRWRDAQCAFCSSRRVSLLLEEGQRISPETSSPSRTRFRT